MSINTSFVPKLKASTNLLHQEAKQKERKEKKKRKMLYRGSSSIGSCRLGEKMSGNGSVPVEVGTRGTIGSLLKKEIEYFRKVELDYSSLKSQPGNGGSSSWPGFGFLMLKWKKKKRRVSGGGGGGLQGVCSLVDVSDSHRINEIRGFSYVNLKVDSKRFEEQSVFS